MKPLRFLSLQLTLLLYSAIFSFGQDMPADEELKSALTGSQMSPSTPVPTAITVPGTYANLTGTGGAFDMINQGGLSANTVITITGDVTEPGTVALNGWTEYPAGSNYTLRLKPDGTVLRTISGSVLPGFSHIGMLRINGASRFTIDGGPGKSLRIRFSRYPDGCPTIQYNNGSLNDTLKNCIIENNGTYYQFGTINIGYGSTIPSTVVIENNDIHDATGGTVGIQTTGIALSFVSNSVKILNNNISNYDQFGIYCQPDGFADGMLISGNSFFYNNSTYSNFSKYAIYYISNHSNHTITGNYIGGQAPMCGGAPWTIPTGTDIYGIYGWFGSAVPSTISNNTIQNIRVLSGAIGDIYSIYFPSGSFNIINNIIGSTTVVNSISSAGSGNFYGIYIIGDPAILTNIQGNIISGINFTGAGNNHIYGIEIAGGLVNAGTVTPNIIGSNTVAGSITYAGNSSIFGIYSHSSVAGCRVENNIIGNLSLTATSGSPTLYGMYIGSGDYRKNRIVGLGSTVAAQTPTIYGIYNGGSAGAATEISNNLVTLDGGLSTNPNLYAFYDGTATTATYNLYFNDFNIYGPATTTSKTCSFYRGVTSSYVLRNNIFSNYRIAGGSGKHYAVNVATSGGWNSNNNDIWSLAGPLGNFNAADQLTLASWQTASGGDLNAQNVDPQFFSVTDLHTNKIELNNNGVIIPAVTTDYDGVTRGNPPDIGAYEIPGPLVVTTAATSVSTTGATLNGTVNGNYWSTSVFFDWGLTTAYGNTITASPGVVGGNNTVAVSAVISGLTVNTTYHFRARGVYVMGTVNGNDMTFTTSCTPPVPTITGSADLCVNSGYYNYTTEAGMSNYQWYVSPGGMINWGLGTNVITVSWGTPGPQLVTVSYTNPAGCSPTVPSLYPVMVDPLPGAAGDISGPASFCTGYQKAFYTVGIIPDALTYVWTVPAGATIVSGLGTNSITVDFDTSAVSGNIIVCGNNLCGNGPDSPPFPVTIYPIPAAPVITQQNDSLFSNEPAGNQWYYEGILINGATDPVYAPTQNGYYWDVVTLNGCPSDTSNHQQIVNLGTDAHSPGRIILYPVPNNGIFTIRIASPSEECLSICVYNHLGVKIQEAAQGPFNGPVTRIIDLRPLPAGLYTLTLTGGKENVIRKFVVLK
ncbi:MAG: T9SS type A sorting domain-containing protein [Bacteroidetes bacterium]|nr:T9SS type A sorting domain-containing protein [Bacteroidota bacterium]